MIKLLLVSPCEDLKVIINKGDFETSIVLSPDQAGDLIGRDHFDLILIDLPDSCEEKKSVIREIAANPAGIPVIGVTPDSMIAVDFVKMGMTDYIPRPIDAASLMSSIRAAVSRRVQTEVKTTKQAFVSETFSGLIGRSRAMQKLYDMIARVADTDSTVLITGESGTGKELVARTIHKHSGRSDGPFVPINCAAIPKDLLESELFGHERGSFTGALTTRIGRFELSHSGTLFLDEIGELDPSLQVKLLRVIQEREFERVGGVKTIKVDVRILAATNKDLDRAVAEEKFREDLYYRLNVIPIHLPSLRERSDDIALLMHHFIKVFSEKKRRQLFHLSSDAMQCLMRYSWPGNVRELENLVERLMILLNGNTVTVADLPEKFRSGILIEEPENVSEIFSFQQSVPPGDTGFPDEGINLNEVVGGLERDFIIKAIERAGGVKSKAASLLGLNRTTLIEKMKKMGIDSFRKTDL